MTTILCFGDSNTWGADPAELGRRFDRHTRWTGVLQKLLGADDYTIEEGMSGRTTVWDDPLEGYASGKDYLLPCLKSHKPLDWVILVLGTNDLQAKFNLSPADVGCGVRELVKMVQQSDCGLNGQAPAVLLVCPPPLGKLTYFAEQFAGAEAKSRRLPPIYAQIAQERGCAYLETPFQTTDTDGIHWEAEQHTHFAQAVATFLLTR